MLFEFENSTFNATMITAICACENGALEIYIHGISDPLTYRFDTEIKVDAKREEFVVLWKKGLEEYAKL